AAVRWSPPCALACWTRRRRSRGSTRAAPRSRTTPRARCWTCCSTRPSTSPRTTVNWSGTAPFYRGLREMTTFDEQSLGMLLKRANESMVQAKSAVLKPVGLTLAQYVMLSELDKHPGLTGAALARACLVTPQAMMVVLKAADEQGLIERIPHPRHANVIE